MSIADSHKAAAGERRLKPAGEAAGAERPSPARFRLAVPFRIARKYRMGAVGAVWLTTIALLAALAPVVSPHTPTEFLGVGPFAKPSPDAWLGTDQIGRDLFVRLLYGARTSLSIAAAATVIGVGVGTFAGVTSGYLGGKTDLVVQRLMDVIDAFPALVLAILLVAMLGSSATNVVIAISVVLIPGTNRVARSVTLGVRALAYIEAAHAVGASPARVIGRHILPGLLAPMIIVATAVVGSTIVAEASLSFLGLGPPPPTPTWGQMLSGDARQYFVTEPWLVIVPGLALTMTVVSVSLIGDALRDGLDPHSRTR